jgi:hypothetical protein
VRRCGPSMIIMTDLKSKSSKLIWKSKW